MVVAVPASAVPPPVADTAVHNPQHGNTAGTVGQEVGGRARGLEPAHACGSAGCLQLPGSGVQLPQVLSQLLKVHLEKQG